MDIIPKELQLLILGHLDVVDFGNIGRLFKEYNIQLTQNDYLSLLVGRFPQYYKKNIIKYNIQYLYVSLLGCTLVIDDVYDLINNINNLIETRTWNDDKLKEYLPYHELYKYLLIENFVEISMDYSDTIFIYDDLDTFQIFKEYFYDNYLSTTYYNAIRHNSNKILDYLLTQYTPEIDDSDISSSIVGIYNIEEEVNPEIIKKLIEYIDTDNRFKILILANNQETIDFLLDLLKPSVLDSIEIASIIDVYKYRIGDALITYQKFKLIWDVYSSYFVEGDILDFYNLAGTAGDFDSMVEIITFLAHQPVIEKKYLI